MCSTKTAADRGMSGVISPFQQNSEVFGHFAFKELIRRHSFWLNKELKRVRNVTMGRLSIKSTASYNRYKVSKNMFTMR